MWKKGMFLSSVVTPKPTVSSCWVKPHGWQKNYQSCSGFHEIMLIYSLPWIVYYSRVEQSPEPLGRVKLMLLEIFLLCFYNVLTETIKGLEIMEDCQWSQRLWRSIYLHRMDTYITTERTVNKRNKMAESQLSTHRQISQTKATFTSLPLQPTTCVCPALQFRP